MRTLPLPSPEAVGVWGYATPTSYTAERMRAYALAEREACAQVCDERANDENDAQWCAERIRARN